MKTSHHSIPSASLLFILPLLLFTQCDKKRIAKPNALPAETPSEEVTETTDTAGSKIEALKDAAAATGIAAAERLEQVKDDATTKVGQAWEATKDKAGEAGNVIKEKSTAIAETVKDKGSKAFDATKEKAAVLKEKAGEATSVLKEKAGRAKEALKEKASVLLEDEPQEQ